MIKKRPSIFYVLLLCFQNAEFKVRVIANALVVRDNTSWKTLGENDVNVSYQELFL